MVNRGRCCWQVLSVVLAAASCSPPTPASPESVATTETPTRVAARRFDDAEPAPIPEVASNASCMAARAAYIDSWDMHAADRGAPDLSHGQLATVLSHGRFFDRCRVPQRYEVKICAAVQQGKVLGATVSTEPRAPRIERCIDRQVRDLAFPSHPRMDVTRTVFQASR